MFSSKNRFTTRAQVALQLAQQDAATFGHSYVGSEHLLLGLLNEGCGIAARVLLAHHITATTLRGIIVGLVGAGVPDAAAPQGLSIHAKQIIQEASAVAARMAHPYVGTEHLLLGLLTVEHTTALRALAALHLSPQGLQQAVRTAMHVDVLADDVTPANVGRKPSAKGLEKYGKDLTQAARMGKLDPVIGRDAEITRTMQILSRRQKNNPVLIGEAGVGKTAVAEGLAQRIVGGNAPENLLGKRIFSLDLTHLVAGTKYRGEFEERVKSMLTEVHKNPDVLLFIDELHMLVGVGAAEGAIDAANILKPALARGEIQVIGATTRNEYRTHIEKDAALARRFQTVAVEEPSAADAVCILQGLRVHYETHHRLQIAQEAIEAAVALSQRYLHGRFLPDKAIDLLDEAAAWVRMQPMTPSAPVVEDAEERLFSLEDELEEILAHKKVALEAQDFATLAVQQELETSTRTAMQQRDCAHACQTDTNPTPIDAAPHAKTVTAADIAAVVARQTGIPLCQLTADQSAQLLTLEAVLHTRVMGQHAAVQVVARAMRRARVGLHDPRRPIGSFLFLGPSGVGKTELCKALAAQLFGEEKALIRLDMSEYMEKHMVARLIGAPAGYVGFEEGGQLTEAVRRRPYAVVLFDEIEKAHADVSNLLLQILEEGTLTDSHGRAVSFQNTVVILTSNVGADRIAAANRPSLGFGEGTLPPKQHIEKEVRTACETAFRPELRNRLDEIVVFEQLSHAQLRAIAHKMLAEVAARAQVLGVALTWTDAVCDALLASDATLHSARPLRRAVRTQVEDALATALLQQKIQAGQQVQLVCVAGALVLEVVPTDAPQSLCLQGEA